MAASIGFYDTDDTTLLQDLALGIVPPGSSYFEQQGMYVELRAKNDGDEAYSLVEVEIQQAGTYPGYEHLRIAADDGGAPGTFQDYTANPLALGALGVDEVAPVWVDVVVPSDFTGAEGQAENLVLIATV